MIGPFRRAPGSFEYVYIMIDKFSKQIEYKPLMTATAYQNPEKVEGTSIVYIKK